MTWITYIIGIFFLPVDVTLGSDMAMRRIDAEFQVVLISLILDKGKADLAVYTGVPVLCTDRHYQGPGRTILKQTSINPLLPIASWACEKVVSDLGLGGGFHRVLRFPPLLTTG